ncbi:ybl124 [Escherichia coli]|uniref:Ybl124 n=1 Tax=Escherichia coli TaxID=562 RepID=A0A376VD61_ECOLX|nr:ybl124 [Escherichia coli]
MHMDMELFKGKKILHWTTWPVFLVLLIFTTQFTFHFDIWVTHPSASPDDIKNFRNSFNKAKAQRKYKKMQEDKVNVQFFS